MQRIKGISAEAKAAKIAAEQSRRSARLEAERQEMERRATLESIRDGTFGSGR